MKRTGIRATVVMFGVFILTASFFQPPAEAILIELEPDMFRVGTNVTNLFEGVTINRYISSNTGPLPYTPPSYGSVYVETPQTWNNLAPTGTHTFGNFHGSIEAMGCWSGSYCGGFSAMLIQFDSPTNYVEIAASYGAMGGGDDAIAYAFDGNRQFVGWERQDTSIRNRTFDEEGNAVFEYAGIAQIGSLDRDPYIQSVVVGGWDTWGTLDRIRFNRVAGVPEPSSFLPLGIGLAGLVLWRWKQTA